MIKGRINQFFKYVSSYISDDDKLYIEKSLNTNEKELFYKLSIHEQKHSINVARDIEKICNQKDIIKAALLHDIGKIYIKLNLIDKSILVILDFITKGKLKRLSKLKKVNCYYNHGDIGYYILKDIENEEVLFLVKNHHNNSINNNLKLNILKKYDDKN
ncbi:HD family phosphohydrolase [Clostridium acetobutylicum]|nr:HD family phosphohydrolase [Clostridium acetobutylicum]